VLSGERQKAGQPIKHNGTYPSLFPESDVSNELIEQLRDVFDVVDRADTWTTKSRQSHVWLYFPHQTDLFFVQIRASIATDLVDKVIGSSSATMPTLSCAEN
jgi:hypothetical protein